MGPGLQGCRNRVVSYRPRPLTRRFGRFSIPALRPMHPLQSRAGAGVFTSWIWGLHPIEPPTRLSYSPRCHSRVRIRKQEGSRKLKRSYEFLRPGSMTKPTASSASSAERYLRRMSRATRSSPDGTSEVEPAARPAPLFCRCAAERGADGVEDSLLVMAGKLGYLYAHGAFAQTGSDPHP